MPRFFGRVWKVSLFRSNGDAITPRTPGGGIDLNPLAFDHATAIEITELDIACSITKKLVKNPNTCELTIYNLAESTRAFIKERPLTVKIEAGHDAVLRHVFLGDIRFASSELTDATTWETTIHLKDGGRAFANGFLSKAYAKNTPVRTLLKDAAAAMGLTLPSNLDDVSNFNARIPRGHTVDADAEKELTRLLAPYGFGWSIQNGSLQVMRSDQVRDDNAYIVDEATAGLIGSPQYSVPQKESKPTKLDFKTLLWPEMIPGVKVDMRTRAARGLHKVIEVKHNFRTDGDQWETSCEATVI